MGSRIGAQRIGAVDLQRRHCLLQAPEERFLHFAQSLGAGPGVDGGAHTQDPGGILCAGAERPLLPSAQHPRRKARPGGHDQRAAALGAADLMGRQSVAVGVPGLHVRGDP